LTEEMLSSQEGLCSMELTVGICVAGPKKITKNLRTPSYGAVIWSWA